jgi:hypothetical protein
MSMLTILAIAAWAWAIAGLACDLLDMAGRLERGLEYGWGMFALTDCCLAARNAVQSHWGSAAWFSVCAACCAFAWWTHWRRRRKRRRAAAALGAKSRALRDALVRRVRELRPRPVLRPSPVPA